jgi:LmbE family N-acetylglucosaminyl deacetylase
MDERRLLCVLAHPDDESLGLGGTLAKYAAEGVATFVVTATRGEGGWPRSPAEHPGSEALAVLREAELRAAAATLGVREVEVLGYPDGRLSDVPLPEMVASLVVHIRRVRPQVVVTFPPDGITGHPDHIAIAQNTLAAVVAASDPTFGVGAAHRVTKLYYLVASQEAIDDAEQIFGSMAMEVDGQRRIAPAWPKWAITTRVDATACWRQAWQAVACHETQLIDSRMLARLPPATHQQLWGRQEFFRVFSLVNSGPGPEDELFTGLP